MENLAVITALYHSGFFRNHLLCFRKDKNVIHQPRSFRIGRNCARGRRQRLNNIYVLTVSDGTTSSLRHNMWIECSVETELLSRFHCQEDVKIGVLTFKFCMGQLGNVQSFNTLVFRHRFSHLIQVRLAGVAFMAKSSKEKHVCFKTLYIS